MAIFDKVFNITDPDMANKARYTSLDSTAEAIDSRLENNNEYNDVVKLREYMRDDGINVDGNQVIGAGTGSLVLSTSSLDGNKIPDAITRIETLGPPIDNPIVIRHAYAKEHFISNDDPNGKYQTYIVPFVPDVKNPDHPNEYVRNDDILRTIRVLKALGQENHIVDLSLDNFVFLKDKEGNVMRYPKDTKDVGFRNKPIAFIRDLNACPAREKVAKFLQGMTNAHEVFLEKGVKLEDVIPAPADCVEACKQQYFYTAKLAENLRQNGIQPNVDIPAGKWTAANPSGTRPGMERKH